MRKLKRTLAFLLTLSLVLGIGISAFAEDPSYADVPDSHWAHDVIIKWSGENYNALEGVGEGAFAPEKGLKLGELVKIFERYFETDDKIEADEKDYETVLTREAAIKYFAEAFGIAPVNSNTVFADDESISAQYKPYVNAFQRLGYISGKPGNVFDPAGELTRAEAMKIIDSVSQKGIIAVSTIGFIDTDGSKTATIVAQYNVELDAKSVAMDDFAVENYGLSQGDEKCEIGKDPGKVLKVYVNDKPEVSSAGGTATGKYVIIEINTDYQLGSVCKKYPASVAASVTQVGEVSYADGTITADNKKVSNYEIVSEESTRNGETTVTEWKLAIKGTYSLPDAEQFDLFTVEDGTAFKATNCFEEATGEYVDVNLPYALYVPDDYDASKKYALVLHIEDAGFLGTDPMIALTESQGPVNYTSKEIQDVVKKDGLGGIIVVTPQVESSLRSTRDDYSLSAAVPATWQLMDYLTDKYNIDENRIYGEGQSMGGMQVVAMAAQRDNYFAALWANGCQWGNNFNLEDPTYNSGTGYFEAPADGTIIWTKDSDGNEVDYRNWYYMVSDDNILITNCIGDAFSTSVWKELKYLYLDLAGATIPYASWNPLTTSVAAQNAALEKLVAQDNELGMYWYAFDGGNHMATWIYSHGITASHKWLVSQTRESEMKREKLDLDKPFEKAAVQSTDTDRAIAGGSTYLLTGKEGAGTADYNSALYGQGGGTLVMEPGWTVD